MNINFGNSFLLVLAIGLTACASEKATAEPLTPQLRVPRACTVSRRLPLWTTSTSAVVAGAAAVVAGAAAVVAGAASSPSLSLPHAAATTPIVRNMARSLRNLLLFIDKTLQELLSVSRRAVVATAEGHPLLDN